MFFMANMCCKAIATAVSYAMLRCATTKNEESNGSCNSREMFKLNATGMEPVKTCDPFTVIFKTGVGGGGCMAVLFKVSLLSV
jgi:hypothetical protein